MRKVYAIDRPAYNRGFSLFRPDCLLSGREAEDGLAGSGLGLVGRTSEVTERLNTARRCIGATKLKASSGYILFGDCPRCGAMAITV